LEVAEGDACPRPTAGNLVSATPSGGFMNSAPVVRGLGFPTSTRGQMMSLDKLDGGGLAAKTLRGGGRPRTTLSPTLALKGGKPDVAMAFGTPGADGQGARR
jgi:gamma-glutamyltranspeptidase/glutathione hydrolase